MKMNEQLAKLPTPAVVVDLDTAEKNIRNMQENASRCGLSHRPHVKTHRSSELARMQVELGCAGVTAAKLGEAEVMAQGGITDIFIAYPLIGADKLERLLALSEKVRVSTVLNSIEGARAMSEAFVARGKTIDVLLEVDGGLNRGGVKPGQPLVDFACAIQAFAGISIQGLMYYGGLVYDSHDRAEVEGFAKKERDALLSCAKLLADKGFCMRVLSAGSSLTGKTPEDLKGITEIRSGHYIFNDCSQLDVGLAAPEDCALFVVMTVVSKPDAHTVICDAGTKSLTGDRCHHRGGYGYITDYPDIEIYQLNEEHAFLRTQEDNPLQIGQKICVIPNHACVVTNLAGRVYGFRGEEMDHMIEIDAQGHSV